MSFQEYNDDYTVPGGNQDMLEGYKRLVDHLSVLLEAAPGIDVRLRARALRICRPRPDTVEVHAHTATG